MAVYIGHDECRVIYVARNGQQLRVSSVWVGDQQVFPPANRQEIHLFNRDTQGYGRTDNGTHFGFTVPVPWWATAMDVVIIGAGEKGRDGTKSFTGGSDGAGGRSGAWVVKTVALTQSADAVVRVGKGTATAPHATEVILPGVGGQSDVRVHDGEGVRTANSGSTGGSVTPISRAEFGSDHHGGSGGGRNNVGAHPGGGGGGGQGSNLLGNPTSGRNGGDGYVWLRFRSNAPISAGFTLFLGVTSGAAYQPLRDWAVSIGETYMTITEITVPVEVIGPSLYSLFYGCSALAAIPALDASQVTNMVYMFAGCSSLTTIPALDTSSATDMDAMFVGCSSLTAIPALDSSQVTNMAYMFAGCSSLESVTLPGMGNGFTTGSAEVPRTLDMRDTKLNAAAANALMQSLGTPPPGGNLQLPATATGAGTGIAIAKNWTVTIGDEMGALRVGVTSGVAYLPLHEWAVGIGKTYRTITEITVPVEVIGPSLQQLFYDCSSLVIVPDLDTSPVTNMIGMFYNCRALTTVPALDTSRVASMQAMFYGCSSLTSIPALDTSRVTDMHSMFYGCRALTSVPALDTSQVTTMYAMFYGCRALTTVPALDASQVTDTDFMLDNCSSLESVTLPGMGSAFAAKQTLGMKTTKLNTAAANALMQSLGTVPAAANGSTLALPATATGADTSIATAKNWQVTIG